jgi:hypothetical protein
VAIGSPSRGTGRELTRGQVQPRFWLGESFVENGPRVLGPKAKIDLHRVPPLVVDLLPEETVPRPLTEKMEPMRGPVG